MQEIYIISTVLGILVVAYIGTTAALWRTIGEIERRLALLSTTEDVRRILKEELERIEKSSCARWLSNFAL